MASVRSLSPEADVDASELEEIAQDVFRMVRRARATRESRIFTKRALQQIVQVIHDQSEEPVSPDLESLWEFSRQHSQPILEATRPFSSFFNTNGLLPDEVSPWSLLAYLLVKGVESGAFRQN